MSPNFAMTFNEYGKQRFLSKVKISLRGYQYVMTKTKAERELEQSQTAHRIRLVPLDKASR